MIKIIGDNIEYNGVVVAKIVVPESTIRERFVENFDVQSLESSYEDGIQDGYSAGYDEGYEEARDYYDVINL